MFKWLCLLMVFSAAGISSASQWPKIQGFDRTFQFSRPEDMYVHFPVLSPEGKELYIVECAGIQNVHANVENFAYSGQFECRLSLPEARVLPDCQLLVDDPQADREWMSRGRFFWNQLVGACRHYPDYGSRRVFQLRNIKLIITVSNAQLAPTNKGPMRDFLYSIEGLTVNLKGFYDPGSNSGVAGPSRYKEPGPAVPGEGGGYLDCKKPVLRAPPHRRD